MKCTDCKYCVLQDNGYSNYTVEGTDADCLLDLNPDLPKDAWYGKDDALEFANHCEKFIKGDSPSFDVDGEITIEEYSDDEEIYGLLKKWKG